jgi:hypothetical protein
VIVSQQGDALRLKFGNAFAGPLSHWEYETFRARWEDRRNGDGIVTFRPDGVGHIAALQLLGMSFAKLPTAR